MIFSSRRRRRGVGGGPGITDLGFRLQQGHTRPRQLIFVFPFLLTCKEQVTEYRGYCYRNQKRRQHAGDECNPEWSENSALESRKQEYRDKRDYDYNGGINNRVPNFG